MGLRKTFAVAGFLLEKEVSSLEGAMNNPEHPLLVIIGGAKVEDKQPLIDKFLPIADHIVVGGKIAADGYQAKSDKIDAQVEVRLAQTALRKALGTLN